MEYNIFSKTCSRAIRAWGTKSGKTRLSGMRDIRLRTAAYAAAMLLTAGPAAAQTATVNDYSVKWESPSGNASGAMPIGNGEVGANVWMEDNGNLLFYLSRTDAWSENSSLYKLGRIRISLFPALKGADVKFSHALNLVEGKMKIRIADAKDQMAIDLWIDSDAPVVYVSGHASYPVQVMASSEIWRTQTRLVPNKERHFSLQGCPHEEQLTEYPDQTGHRGQHLMVFHRNEHSIYPFTLKHQQLGDAAQMGGDPLMHRTMGYNISGEGLELLSPTQLCTREKQKTFALKVVAHTAQTATADEWMAQTEEILAKAPAADASARRTAAYWQQFWDKSYLRVDTPDRTTGFKITQAYILQNWMMACGGRGNFPIKFNGSIFTVDPVYTDPGRTYSPDYRMWGPDYWWQNTRLVYHPMLKSGDYDMMQVLFRHYKRVLPMMKRNAEVLWKAKGAVSPETATIFGTFVNHDYGWDPNKKEVIDNPYVRYYWSSSLEIASLMADYYQYTGDKTFAIDTLIPIANEFLAFYTSFFPRNAEGKLTITPTHALEMYWNNVVNDLPNVAGLHYLIGQLLQLPKGCTTPDNVRQWKELQAILPPVPTRLIDGKRVFAAAEKFDPKATNAENPELYAVFPFALCHVGARNLQQGIDTYFARNLKQMHGWAQDGQQAARLGLTEEAKANLIAKLGFANKHHRFPVIWGPNFDWTPDQDHGSNLLTTLQDMVMQSYDGTVYLLPAFPKDWEVSFRLHAPRRTVVTGHYKDGKWQQLPTLSGTNKLKLRY